MFFNAELMTMAASFTAEKRGVVCLVLKSGAVIEFTAFTSEGGSGPVIGQTVEGSVMAIDRDQIVGFESRFIDQIEGAEDLEPRFDDHEWSLTFVSLRAACDRSEDETVRALVARLDEIEAALEPVESGE